VETPKYAVWKSESLARVYLTGVRGAIPFAQEQIDVMLRLLAATERKIERVLDLGCGDGLLADALSMLYPDAALVFLDFSEPMLEAARERLRDRSAPTAFLQADYGKPNWTDAVVESAPFDAVISGYSIHHQPDRRKREVYEEILQLLNPGAMFVNIEHVASPTTWVTKLHDELFIDHLHRAQPGASRENVANSYHYRPDKDANILASVEDQCEWLRHAGFVDVDCYLKVFALAVFGGRKPQ